MSDIQTQIKPTSPAEERLCAKAEPFYPKDSPSKSLTRSPAKADEDFGDLNSLGQELERVTGSLISKATAEKHSMVNEAISSAKEKQESAEHQQSQ